jgi:hypothetical protein
MRNYGKVGTYEGLRVSRCWGIDPDTGARRCYTQVKHDCPLKRHERRNTILLGVFVVALVVVNTWLVMEAL